MMEKKYSILPFFILILYTRLDGMGVDLPEIKRKINVSTKTDICR